MYMSGSEAEFSELRSSRYNGALTDFPDAWRHDVEDMLREVRPSKGQTIVDLGGGTGYFSRIMADAVGPDGEVIIVDPSLAQTSSVPQATYDNIKVLVQDATEIDLGGDRKADTIWSRGAFHHVIGKDRALDRFRSVAAKQCRLIIADVFQGQRTARFFDDFVARTCITGHEVAYLSPEFAQTLCSATGWKTPRIRQRTMLWRFASSEEMARFLITLFAAREGTTLDECLHSVNTHLEVTEFGGAVYLHWPMTLLSTELAD
jgi:ubiquinone/menaquinone biosynthesis C-methylase UbiE